MNIIRSAIVLLILITLSLSAQSKYLSHSDQYSTIKELVNDHSSISRIIEIGKTVSSKELYVVEIAKGDIQNKPGFLVIAGVEPDDLAGTAEAHSFIEMILNNAEVDSIKSLIENYSLYVLPRLSPDALDGYFENVKSEYPGNHQSYDLDRDGVNDEDGFNDLNNDNLISMMRIEDPDGEWIEDNKLSGLMIKADPKKGQAGKYKLLFEGKDDDGDGKVNEDPVGGINVNMNGTNEYKPYETYGGDHPFAADELIALADFLFERPNILSVFTFNYHNNFDKGWKIKYKGRRSNGNMFSTDSAAYNALASDLKPLAKYSGEKLNNGSIAGWAFYDAGRFSFSAPAWTYHAVKDSSEKKDKKKTDESRETLAYKWIVNNTPGNYLEWNEIKHPDFPNQKVEIGGFVPFAKNNPPEDSLTIISKNANKLLFRLYKSLPLLKVTEPLVEDLGNNVFRVTLTIKNEGTLPTHTEVGRAVKALQPVLIKTKPAKSQTLASGNEITFIQDPITGGSAVSKSFVIVGKGRVVFNIGSPSAGYNELNVQL